MADRTCLSEMRLALVLNELLELGYKELDMLRSIVEKADAVVKGARYLLLKEAKGIYPAFLLEMILVTGDQTYRNKMKDTALEQVAKHLAKKASFTHE